MTSGKKEKGYFGLTYKIIVLGESNTDKSALIKRYIYIMDFIQQLLEKKLKLKLYILRIKKLVYKYGIFQDK